MSGGKSAGEPDRRAAAFAALGEPVRLAVVDHLVPGDLSPGELGRTLGVSSNLLAHHLRVLEDAGLIRRLRSEGDGRRGYLRLVSEHPAVRAAIDAGPPARWPGGRPVLFVCTANSARSQLAAATWNSVAGADGRARSAGTHPADRIHPGALAVARRHRLPMPVTSPRRLDPTRLGGELVVAVCDNAHEELDAALPRLHWSVPDPIRRGTDEAFEDAYAEIDRRVRTLAALHARPAGS